MPISNGTKIGVSTETPSLYFDSFLIAFVVSTKACNDSNVMFPQAVLTFLCISLSSGNKILKFHRIVFYFYMKNKKMLGNCLSESDKQNHIRLVSYNL